MTVRSYSANAQATNLTAGVTPSGTTVSVAATTGFPGSVPFIIALDYDSPGEEICLVTLVAGTTLTVTRGYDGTSAQSHPSGAVVRHVASAQDFRDSRDHENASTNVHGLSGGAAVVGTSSTQTLSNKTLDDATGTLVNVDIYNQGAFRHAVIGDSANPSVAKMAFLKSEADLSEQLVISSTGSLTSVNPGTGDTDLRMNFLASDGTTVRAQLLSGGTLYLQPTSTTTRTPVLIATDESNTEIAYAISNVDGSNVRYLVRKNGAIETASTISSVGAITGGVATFTTESVSGTSAFTVGSGLTLTSAVAKKTAKVVTISIVVSHTAGFNSTATSDISVGDVIAGTIASGYRPTDVHTVQVAKTGTAPGFGIATIGTDGIITLHSWVTGNNVTAGQDLRFATSYVI
jgi:hypothetical protein